jgi:hypothetical protein
MFKQISEGKKKHNFAVDKISTNACLLWKKCLHLFPEFFRP